MYLARWQHLLDETLVAPAEPRGGTLRRGRDVRGFLGPRKTGAGAGADAGAGGAVVSDGGLREGGEEEPRPPDVGVVIEALGQGFRELVSGLVRG